VKRLFTMVLIAALAFSLFAGCSNASAGETTAPSEAPLITEPTQSPEEEKVLKIMIIGNSHSNDTFWLLHNVFADQMPDQEVVLGIMYYSGCTVSKHVQFAAAKQKVYEYHCNIDGVWNTAKSVSLDTGLSDQAWDIVVFQGGRGDTENQYNLTGRRALEQIVKNHVAQPYKMMWQITWPSPDDPKFFSADHPVQPPAGWVEYLQNNYDHNTFKQFGVMVDKPNPYLLEDETYEKVISVGAGIMHAHAAVNVPQAALWRDYTHLSDYGRLIAAYTFYAQFTGNAVSEVNIDVIPAALRHWRSRGEGDLTVTEEMKQAIIASANHALKDPWTPLAKPAAN